MGLKFCLKVHFCQQPELCQEKFAELGAQQTQILKLNNINMKIKCKFYIKLNNFQFKNNLSYKSFIFASIFMYIIFN